MKLVFAASLLSMQHQGITVKTGRPGMGIMCGSGATLSTHGLLFQCVSTIQIQLQYDNEDDPTTQRGDKV